MSKLKPHKILWWTIPVIFMLFAFTGNIAVDLQWHDTYYVVTALNVAILISIFLVFLGLIYWRLRSNHLHNKLSLTHSIGTSISLFGISSISLFLESFYILGNFKLFGILNRVITILIITFIGLQILFVVNLAIGLRKSERWNFVGINQGGSILILLGT